MNTIGLEGGGTIDVPILRYHHAPAGLQTPTIRDERFRLALGACDRCIRLWAALSQEDRIPGAGQVARTLGFRNRYQFARWLGRHGYPAFQALVDWTQLIQCTDRWWRRRMPLARQAWAVLAEPSVLHRRLRRVTGLPWTEIRRRSRDEWQRVLMETIAGSLLCVGIGAEQGCPLAAGGAVDRTSKDSPSDSWPIEGPIGGERYHPSSGLSQEREGHERA